MRSQCTSKILQENLITKGKLSLNEGECTNKCWSHIVLFRAVAWWVLVCHASLALHDIVCSVLYFEACSLHGDNKVLLSYMQSLPQNGDIRPCSHTPAAVFSWCHAPPPPWRPVSLYDLHARLLKCSALRCLAAPWWTLLVLPRPRIPWRCPPYFEQQWMLTAHYLETTTK